MGKVRVSLNYRHFCLRFWNGQFETLVHTPILGRCTIHFNLTVVWAAIP